MTWLFNNCDTYIFLSLFEGFSLTPAEALCCGKNVILSDIPVHKEIYNNVVNFVDPLSVKSIANVIELRNQEKYLINKKDREKFITNISIESFIDNLYQIILNA